MDLLVPGVHAQLADVPGHGAANAAVVVDEDGTTVVDTLMVPSQYEPFAAEVACRRECGDGPESGGADRLRSKDERSERRACETPSNGGA